MAGAYTIGKLAAQAECSVPTIRYYEDIGLLRKPHRNAGGQRIYDQHDLARLGFIRRCRDFQFSVEQIRELAGMLDNPARDCGDAKDLADRHLATVRGKLIELRKLEAELARFARECASSCLGGPMKDCIILDDLSCSCGSST